MSELTGNGAATVIRSEAADLTERELFSIAYADADGWRCFYPRARGHLTAEQARAVMRRERNQPPETLEEAAEAERLLAFGDLWDAQHSTDLG